MGTDQPLNHKKYLMSLTNVFACFEPLVFFAWKNLECVGTKVVTLTQEINEVQWDDPFEEKRTHLCLKEVCCNNFTAVAIKECKRRAECGCGDSPKDGLRDNSPPTRLGLMDSFVEEIIEEEGFDVDVLLIGGSNVAKEDTLNNAASTPHLSDPSVIQVPAQLYSMSENKAAYVE